MIVNKINCSLNSNGIDILKGLKNGNASIFSEIIDGKTVIVKIQRDDIVYFITNKPTVQMDGDEYPILTIDTNSQFVFKENFALRNVKILSISIIKDRLCWIRDGIEWKVEIDVGIKFVTDQIEVYLIALDSVGGLMAFTIGNTVKIPDSVNDLKEQWSYKADEFISLSREQIPVV